MGKSCRKNHTTIMFISPLGRYWLPACLPVCVCMVGWLKVHSSSNPIQSGRRKLCSFYAILAVIMQLSPACLPGRGFAEQPQMKVMGKSRTLIHSLLHGTEHRRRRWEKLKLFPDYCWWSPLARMSRLAHPSRELLNNSSHRFLNHYGNGIPALATTTTDGTETEC